MRKQPWTEIAICTATIGLLFAAVVFTPKDSEAIPAFARKYQTSCSTCHNVYPKLNDFGKAFKDAGFKFPKEDETFIKEKPVMLGAEAQKQMFPHTIWPGTIPGLPPIGLRMNNFFQVTGKRRGNFDVLTPAGTIPPYVPRTDFQTGLFSIFTAGSLGGDIAFWVDDDISIGGDNSNGGLGDGYLKFVNIGQALHLPKDSFSIRAGQFELDLPFSQARNINLSGYDIYEQANFGLVNTAGVPQFVSNQAVMSDPGRGVEISGGHTYGGYHYSFAVVDQNTTGTSFSSPNIPSANGVGFASDSNFKDMYARFSYRVNLERDRESRNEIQAAGPTGPRDHTYINLGTFWFYGRSVNRVLGADSTGSPIVLTAREPFYRVGGDFSFNYHNFNLYGLLMYARDHNLVPIDATGAFIPLPLATGEGSPVPVGFVHGRPSTFTGGFIQADYIIVPWMISTFRWDAVNSGADRLNTIIGQSSAFPQPYSSTRNRFSPAMQFLLRPNVKLSFEYQYRPQQVVEFVTNPTTGLPVAVHPFRTNTAVAGLEFVY